MRSKKCFICGCYYCNTYYYQHCYRCAQKNGRHITRKDIWFQQVCEKLNFRFSRQYMVQRYVNQEWTLPDFKRQHGLAYSMTISILKMFDIKVRSIGQSSLLNKTKQKKRKTCQTRYRVDNPSQYQNTKQKKRETFTKNYGVDNIWKSREYYVWLQSQMMTQHGKKSIPNRYGNMQKYWDSKSSQQKKAHMNPANSAYSKYYESLTDDQKLNLIQRRKQTWWNTMSQNNFKVHYGSKLQSRVSTILANCDINFRSQFFVNRQSYDFRLLDSKFIIQVQGDYWHANPDVYNSSDIISYPGFKKQANEVWLDDYNKKKNAEKYGYFVEYIWQKQMNQLSDQQLKFLIFKKIDKLTKEAYESCKNKSDKKDKE